MQVDEVKAAVLAALPESEVEASSDGNHLNLTVVSSAFEGLTPVKKQQLVYSVLQPAISSGEIHAVHMRTFTPGEWALQS